MRKVKYSKNVVQTRYSTQIRYCRSNLMAHSQDSSTKSQGRTKCGFRSAAFTPKRK